MSAKMLTAQTKTMIKAMISLMSRTCRIHGDLVVRNFHVCLADGVEALAELVPSERSQLLAIDDLRTCVSNRRRVAGRGLLPLPASVDLAHDGGFCTEGHFSLLLSVRVLADLVFGFLSGDLRDLVVTVRLVGCASGDLILIPGSHQTCPSRTAFAFCVARIFRMLAVRPRVTASLNAHPSLLPSGSISNRNLRVVKSIAFLSVTRMVPTAMLSGLALVAD